MLSWLALIFLTMTGYSFGAVAGSRSSPGGKGSSPSPTLLDTGAVVVFWGLGILSRQTGVEALISVVIFPVAAAATGYLVVRTRPHPASQRQLPQ